MRGLGGEVFAHHPGRRGLPRGGEWAPNRRDFGPGKPRIDPKSTPNSPIPTQIGPGLARKSPGWLMVGSRERGKGFLCGEGVGGCLVGVKENFGLLNFCCTRGGGGQGRSKRE